MKQKHLPAHQHVHQNVRTYIDSFTRNFAQIVLIVRYYVITLSFKFHKDPSFCWEDIHEIMLNMHVSCIHAFAKFEYTLVHVFASSKRKYAQIFPKKISVAYYSVIN